MELMAVERFFLEISCRSLKLSTQKALKHRYARESLKVVEKERRREPWSKIDDERISNTRLSLSLARFVYLLIRVTHKLVILIEAYKLPGCSLLRHRGSGIG